MNKLRRMLVSSVLIVSANNAFALACDDFAIKIKNNLPTQFNVSRVNIYGATIQPILLQIDSNSTASFIIKHTHKGANINGGFVLHTLSFPIKMVRINFGFENQLIHCHQFEKTVNSDYSVTRIRTPGAVTYSIN